MNHSSAIAHTYEHTVSFTEAEVKELLLTEAKKTVVLAQVLRGTAELFVPDIEKGESDFTLTFLSSGISA